MKFDDKRENRLPRSFHSRRSMHSLLVEGVVLVRHKGWEAVMRVALLVAVLVLALASAPSANAAANPILVSGNDVKAFCHSESPRRQGVCFGFAIAVAEIVAIEPVAGWRACFPGEVTRGQYDHIMVKYLDDHPEKLHLTATSLAARAFAAAFPCP